MPVPALKSWHKGEIAVQSFMNVPQRAPITNILNALPEQHRIFHCSRLFFLPVTTLDDRGRPWASVLASNTGTPGFIKSPTESELAISVRTWDGDPILQNLPQSATFDEGKKLFSAVGLETTTRRRNKFAGSVVEVTRDNHDLFLNIRVSQALGLVLRWFLSSSRLIISSISGQ